MSDAQTATRVAQAAVSQARSRIAAAEAARTAAGGARRANQALFDDATIETNPEVVAAQARLNQARVDLARTVNRAPEIGRASGRERGCQYVESAGVSGPLKKK